MEIFFKSIFLQFNQEEEELMLLSRFAGETELKDWCKCGNCSLDYVVKSDECWCCFEVDRCVSKMEDAGMDDLCITEHRGFENVCLDEWVLDTAAVGLKTRKKKSYSANRGEATDFEYFRAIAYRQFVRFVWEYVGANKRLPLCLF
ncbi:uncharacterized protein LOC114576243 [Exaiptasia diaphana]|uniref:Uncharacterized protein n=1 Tax=Exaiptasia diaphana TaxID=2652724 RepID=A0A913YUW9_EXADI|nr:uncharacterized protein LOC114576243 [Exaiptasia diaphana]